MVNAANRVQKSASDNYRQQSDKPLFLSENKVLIVEINNCHGECLPGYIKYFQDLGYRTDVLLCENQKNEQPLLFLNNINVSYLPKDDIIKYLNTNTLENYQICFLNSDIIYGKKNVSVLELIKTDHIQSKILCVEHHQENIPVLAQKVIPVVIRKFADNNPSFEVNPHYFGEYPLHHKNIITNFIVVGNIEGKRKNHNLLIASVNELLSRKIYNFKVTVVGKGDNLNIPDEMRKYFDIKGRLSYPDMYDAIAKADFFLPLLDPLNAEHNRYIKTGTSGSFQLIYGFNIPCIIAEKFAELHYFNSENSFIYEENSLLGEAMAKAINIDDNAYQKLKTELNIVSENLYKRSLANLEKAIHTEVKKNIYKAYLCSPSYWWQTMVLRKKQINTLAESVKKRLSTMRIDIKNFGDIDNAVTINAPDAQINLPAWFADVQGAGAVVATSALRQIIIVKVIKNGNLHINFRGIDNRDDRGVRFPLWIDYKSITVDGKELLTAPKAAWHDKPYRYKIPVKDGQIIMLKIKQQPHRYTNEELAEILQKINPNSELARMYLPKIISALGKYFKTPPRHGLRYFLYHQIKAKNYVKTYICGIRIKKKFAP